MLRYAYISCLVSNILRTGGAPVAKQLVLHAFKFIISITLPRPQNYFKKVVEQPQSQQQIIRSGITWI